jgi:hypothetical protein
MLEAALPVLHKILDSGTLRVGSSALQGGPDMVSVNIYLVPRDQRNAIGQFPGDR